MTELIADRRDIDFVLYEQLDTQKLTKKRAYSDLNKKMFDMVISEARNFAVKEIFPTLVEGEREGLKFDGGQVTTPACFKRAWKLFVEGEWVALADDPEAGGQGLPHVIAQAAFDYIYGSNFSFAGAGALAHGAGKMIELFGTKQQKTLFLNNLYSGRWGGTMLLTEPNAGSDVGALTTSAVKNEDGTYSISGNKIFITYGEHDLTDNIIHPVLARIEGAPEGTKGISLFIVPKIRVNDDGTLGEANDVVCTGIEEKMGMHGSPTCSMTLGGRGKCRGFLLGEENRGMMVMFHMMNEARLGCGTQGYTTASVAYLHALDYARQRLQGKDLERAGDANASQVAIINHPDVRRMLLGMKAYVEGMRSFCYYTAFCFDMEKCAETEDEKNYYNDLVGLLTPVVKAYCGTKGFDVCVQAMQVYGGYGYTSEFPVEQLTRDCKIVSIYEGTDGIQAMDLLGRKLGMKKGQVFNNFLQAIQKTIVDARVSKELDDLALVLETTVNRFSKIAADVGKMTGSADFKVAFAFAYPFLDAMGDVIMAWMHLWRASTAAPKLAKLIKGKSPDGKDKIGEKEKTVQKDKNAAFYDGQIKTAAFFINTVLPVTMGKMDSIEKGEKAAVEIAERSFGG